jgi:hypothetical protein
MEMILMSGCEKCSKRLTETVQAVYSVLFANECNSVESFAVLETVKATLISERTMRIIKSREERLSEEDDEVSSI